MSDPWTVETYFEMRNRVWATRDSCFGHYPSRCPSGCANAGKHDAGLGMDCECRECAVGKADND